MGKEIPEKDYAKKMKNLKEQTENIIKGLEKGSKSYGKEIAEAFQADLKRVGLQEKLMAKYNEINGMHLTSSDKYEMFGNYIQTDLDLAKQLFGISGRFGEKEYIAKYGPKSKTLYDKMGIKYNEKVAAMIEDMNKEMEHLISLRVRLIHSKVRPVEKAMVKKIISLLSEMVKDAATYNNNSKEYFKRFAQEDIGENLKDTVEPLLEKGGSFQARKNYARQALEFIGTTTTSEIRIAIAQNTPRILVDDNARKSQECSKFLFDKYNPMLVSIKKECDRYIKEYFE